MFQISFDVLAAYGGLFAQKSSSNGLGTLSIVGIATGGGVLLLALGAFLVWKRKLLVISCARNTEPRGSSSVLLTDNMY